MLLTVQLGLKPDDVDEEENFFMRLGRRSTDADNPAVDKEKV